MLAPQLFLERRVMGDVGLDHEQHFGVGLHFAPPAIDRRDPRHEIHAGGELRVDQPAGKPLCDRVVGTGAVTDEGVAHSAASFAAAARSVSSFLQKQKRT